MVFHAGNFRHFFHDVPNGIYFKQVAYPLHDTGQPFQTHTGVNVRVFQRRVIAFAVPFKLRKYVVPDFHVTVTFTAHLAIRSAAAVFRTAVKVDFRAGAARTFTMFPEVIGFAQTHNVVHGNANFFIPDLYCFIVFFINRAIQPLRRNFQFFGQKFPGPGNGFMLEIIPKREIAQHFKIGAVAVGVAYLVNIRGTDALLAGSNPCFRRRNFSGKIFFHWCHAGVNQK